MRWVWQYMARIWPDRRSTLERETERKFIIAVNGLKTLHVTPEGGMSIDPEEIREQVIASRHALKHFVRKP